MKNAKNAFTLLLFLFLVDAITLYAQALPDYTLKLVSGPQIAPENVQAFDSEKAIFASEELNGKIYGFLQFYWLPGADARDRIQEAGIELLDYVPNYAYIASIPASISSSQLESLGVRSLMSIPRETKLAENLKTGTLGIWALEDGYATLQLMYYQNLDQAEVIRYCEADGLEVLRANGRNNVLVVRAPQDKLEALADLPYVIFLDQISEPGEPEDVLGRALHRANAIDTQIPSGRKYTGEGISVLVRDDGIVGPHIDMQGRLINLTGDVTGTHGDGVAGIMSGAGNLDPRHRGMAAGATTYVTNYEAQFLDNTLSLHTNDEVLVTNSSYSDGCNGGYTINAYTVDWQMYNFPTLMHVFSAGNSNNQSCGYGAGNQWGNITGGHKQGKNVIATANLFSTSVLVNSSSRGPAHDGRIKPDIAANGQEQVSLNPYQQYQSFGGTSGAAPGIAGITAQLHEAYRSLNGGETAEAALLKAILLNTANDLGNPGPDFRFGWGHVNALRAVRTLEEERYFQDTIDQNGANTHTIEIPEGVRQAKVMVYWADPPGTVLTTKALVNNLDITLESPDSILHYPWVLNPTPDPALLNSWAITGIDDLNNMEQVSLLDPQSGIFTLRVTGTEVPMGPQKYFVIYEFLTDELTLTYPIGGEGLAPGDVERIHWDAFGTSGDFLLEYSVDGGASWETIQMASPGTRLLNWTVPNTVTNKALVRVSRNGYLGTSDTVFSIIGVPQNLRVEQTCPDYVRLEWDSVPGASLYDVFLLGDRYMDSIATTSELFFDVPTIQGDPGRDHWMSVRAAGPDNLRGERAVAILFNQGLKNCTLQQNVMLEILSPYYLGVNSCESPISQKVDVQLTNTGTETVNDLEIHYQFNGGSIETATWTGVLAAGMSDTVTFANPFQVNTPGSYPLTVWISNWADEAAYDDTVQVDLAYQFFNNPAFGLNFEEDFENFNQNGTWQIQNPDGNNGWELDFTTGIDGFTDAMRFDNYYSFYQGAQDVLVTPPINLTTAGNNISLKFDLAYAFNPEAEGIDGLRIDVYTDCGATFGGTIYYKEGMELATANPTSDPFEPAQSNQWSIEFAPLHLFQGEEVVLHFVNISGGGNRVYIDNINLENLLPPNAQFLPINSIETCNPSQVLFVNASTGTYNSYQWNFGSGAVPATASGSGPYNVVYYQAGSTVASLIATNGLGSDTFQIQVDVVNPPSLAFDHEATGGFVQFENQSSEGDYHWDFGDGATSTESDPLHVYQQSGAYTVTLTVTNACGAQTLTKTVNITVSSVEEAKAQILAMVTPNPAKGPFELYLSGASSKWVQVHLFDLQGRVIRSWELGLLNGVLKTTLDPGPVPAGLYLLQLQTENGSMPLKLIME